MISESKQPPSLRSFHFLQVLSSCFTRRFVTLFSHPNHRPVVSVLDTEVTRDPEQNTIILDIIIDKFMIWQECYSIGIDHFSTWTEGHCKCCRYESLLDMMVECLHHNAYAVKYKFVALKFKSCSHTEGTLSTVVWRVCCMKLVP